jgi:hypothetical protein
MEAVGASNSTAAITQQRTPFEEWSVGAIDGLPLEVLARIVWRFTEPCERGPIRATCRLFRLLTNDSFHSDLGATAVGLSLLLRTNSPELWRWYAGHFIGASAVIANRFINEAPVAFGCAEIANFGKSWGATNFTVPMCIAAGEGNRALFAQYADWTVDDLDTGLCGAACEAATAGHIDIVRRCKRLGNPRMAPVQICAAAAGNRDIVTQCHQWGMSEAQMQRAANHAAESGHTLLTRQLYRWGAKDLNRIVVAAIGGGQDVLARKAIEWGPVNLNAVICAAAATNNKGMAVYLRWRGAVDFDDAMCTAAQCGHPDLVRLFKGWNAKGVDRCMVEAAGAGHLTVVKLLIECGAKSFSTAMLYPWTATNDDVHAYLTHCRQEEADAQEDRRRRRRRRRRRSQ